MWIGKKVTITIAPNSSLQKFGMLICVTVCPHMHSECHKGSEFILLCLNPTKKPSMVFHMADSLANTLQPRL